MKLKNFKETVDKVVNKVIKEEVEKIVTDDSSKKEFAETFNRFMVETMGGDEKQKLTIEQCGKIMEEIALESGLKDYKFDPNNYGENTELLKGALNNQNDEVKSKVKQVKESLSKKKIKLTESELIEIIEKIIDESDEKLNINLIKEEERPIITTIINRYYGSTLLEEITPNKLEELNKQYVLRAINESMGKLTPTSKKIAEKVAVRISKNNNMSESKIPGKSEYEKAHKKSGSDTKANEKEVSKKMTDYVKDMGDKKKDDEFPRANGGDKRAEQVKDSEEQEFIEDIKGGQHNLNYDRKPEGFDDRVTGQLEGDKLQGNAQVDEDGNPLGNVVPTETGKKFNATRKREGLTKEKNRGYKTFPQKVTNIEKDDLSESVLNDMAKMKHLTKYHKKTQ